MLQTTTTTNLEPFVAEIVSSYVRNNNVHPGEISVVIETVYQSLAALGKPVEPERTPAVPLSESATKNYVICLDCGWRGLMLKPHLRARHGLNEGEYRARWNLPPKHRLTARIHSEQCSALAKERGLGKRNHTIGQRARSAAEDTNQTLVDVEPDKPA